MPTDDLTAVLSDLRDQMVGLRADVREERQGRKTTTRLGALVLVVALVVGGLFVRDLVADQRARERAEAADEVAACQTRIESRRSIRAAIDVAVDEVALYAEVSERDREVLRRRARDRVFAELPEPDC